MKYLVGRERNNIVSLDRYRQKKSNLILDVISHPRDIHVLSRTGDARRDMVLFPGEACADQVWSGPRKYAIVYFKDASLLAHAQKVLCQRPLLDEKDTRVGYTFADRWSVLSTTSTQAYASQNIVTPWQWDNIVIQCVADELAAVLARPITVTASVQTLSHRFLI